MLAISSRRCRADATRKLLSWNSSLTPSTIDSRFFTGSRSVGREPRSFANRGGTIRKQAARAQQCIWFPSLSSPRSFADVSAALRRQCASYRKCLYVQFPYEINALQRSNFQLQVASSGWLRTMSPAEHRFGYVRWLGSTGDLGEWWAALTNDAHSCCVALHTRRAIKKHLV